MNSGAFVMLIIRPAQSQCGGRTYGVTTKTLDNVGSLEIAPSPSGYATIIPIYGQSLYTPELPRNTRVNPCLRRQMCCQRMVVQKTAQKSRFSDSIPALRINKRYRNDTLWLMANRLCP